MQHEPKGEMFAVPLAVGAAFLAAISSLNFLRSVFIVIPPSRILYARDQDREWHLKWNDGMHPDANPPATAVVSILPPIGLFEAGKG